jgi:hypothetical protein
MAITESGITLTFPDHRFFRFQDCSGYKAIQNHLKEVDACWYNQEADELYLIELKQWTTGRLREEDDPDYTPTGIATLKNRISESQVDRLIKKFVDSISMFHSVLLGKPHGRQQIQPCMPFTITPETKVILLCIVDWTDPDPMYIMALNDRFKEKCLPYSKLHGMKNLGILQKSIACQHFNWIS